MTSLNKKKIFISLAGFSLLVAVYLFQIGVLYITPPWKITDPNNPAFDATKFDFRDYTPDDSQYLQYFCALSKRVLKIGAERSDIESIILDSARGKASRNNTDQTAEYLTVEIRALIPTLFPQSISGYNGLILVVEYDDHRRANKIDCKYIGSWDFAKRTEDFFGAKRSD